MTNIIQRKDGFPTWTGFRVAGQPRLNLHSVPIVVPLARCSPVGRGGAVAGPAPGVGAGAAGGGAGAVCPLGPPAVDWKKK